MAEYIYEGYTLKQHPEFGSITIHNSKGPSPEQLRGTFTTRKEAIKSIDRFISSKASKRPVLKTKKVG